MLQALAVQLTGNMYCGRLVAEDLAVTHDVCLIAEYTVRRVQAESVETRSKALNEAFTYALFINVCRSLFEAHKLMFSFLLAVKILQNRKEIDAGMHPSFQHLQAMRCSSLVYIKAVM